jgi:hypothetical protein
MHFINVYFLTFFLSLASSLSAQPSNNGPVLPLITSVFNQATLLPGSGGVFQRPHLGISVGTAFSYNKSPVNQWFQTAKLAVARHQYVQTSVQLFTELGYRRHLWQGIGLEGRLGGGYLHSIPATEVFVYSSSSYQEKSKWGRPQAMVSTALGINYLIPGNSGTRVFVDYQFFLQMPFINQYVPLVPNIAWHAGTSVPLFHL